MTAERLGWSETFLRALKDNGGKDQNALEAPFLKENHGGGGGVHI